MITKQILKLFPLLAWTLATAACGLASDLDDLKPVDTEDTGPGEDCTDADDCSGANPFCVDGECVECETTENCDAARWCDDGDCAPCNNDTHCGPTCGACADPAPYCNDAGEACGECNTANPCEAGNWCNAGTCEDCNTAQHCGEECTTCSAPTPACATDTDGSACVECTTNEDCPSAIGACTPDNTCTCLAHDTDPKANCAADTDCGDTEYACVMDFVGADGGTDTDDHFACLRKCPTSVAMSDGMVCEPRDLPGGGSLIRVWAPATSCFSYAQHVEQFTCQQPLDCSAFADYPVNDASCPVSGANCTYPCLTIDDCPAGEECNSSNVCAIP